MYRIRSPVLNGTAEASHQSIYIKSLNLNVYLFFNPSFFKIVKFSMFFVKNE